MNGERDFSYEKLPSGKAIMRRFATDGSLVEETQAYGILEIGIQYSFEAGKKNAETYFLKRRMVSRRTYEKARASYADMPPADSTVEDFGADLLRGVRAQQRQNKAEAEKRFARSEAFRFPKPDSTNWIRVISGNKSHAVIFASRDWKVLARERTIRTGREWMQLFGFLPPSNTPSIHKGLEAGFEVTANRLALLKASRALLEEVNSYIQNPPETSCCQGSIRPRKKPRRKEVLSWPNVLPPLIAFLSELREENVKVFNHHR